MNSHDTGVDKWSDALDVNRALIQWRRKGLLHSYNDEPAVVFPDNTKMWFTNGILHRLTGPAVIVGDVYEEWHRYGILHRDNGPALVYMNGHKEWYKDGKLHRDNGPAILTDFVAAYYIDGKHQKTITRKTYEHTIQLYCIVQLYKNRKRKYTKTPGINNSWYNSKILEPLLTRTIVSYC